MKTNIWETSLPAKIGGSPVLVPKEPINSQTGKHLMSQLCFCYILSFSSAEEGISTHYSRKDLHALHFSMLTHKTEKNGLGKIKKDTNNTPIARGNKLQLKQIQRDA